MTLGSSSTVRRRRLGAEIRKVREQQNLTADQLATIVGWSAAKLSRLENARDRPEVGDVLDLLDALGVTEPQREQLISIARDAASRGWFSAVHKANSTAENQRAWAELDNAAFEISEFQITVVPALLQTPEYARARFGSGPIIGLPAVDVDEAVDLRMSRQEILTRDAPLTYRVLIDETALVKRCGPPGVGGGQLRHLLTIMELPAVTLRIFPFDAEVEGYHLPIAPFSIYRFAEPTESDLVLIETATSELHLGEEEDVERYRRLFDRLWDVSFSVDDTMDLLEVAVRQISEENDDLADIA